MINIKPQQTQSRLPRSATMRPIIAIMKPYERRLADCLVIPVEIMIGVGGASFLMSAPNSAGSWWRWQYPVSLNSTAVQDGAAQLLFPIEHGSCQRYWVIWRRESLQPWFHTDWAFGPLRRSAGSI